jgi:hypothetical protein
VLTISQTPIDNPQKCSATSQDIISAPEEQPNPTQLKTMAIEIPLELPVIPLEALSLQVSYGYELLLADAETYHL